MGERVDPPPRSTVLETVQIETPEHVAFSYEVAGLGSRFCALAIDSILLSLAALGLLYLIVRLPIPWDRWADGLSPGWAVFLIFLAMFLLYWGYFLVFEGAWDGQTPGKRLLRLRAVRDGGHPVTFAAAAVRNLLRLVDLQPAGTYFVGAVVMLLNRQAKRLGDLAAGTVVIREQTLSDVSPAPAPLAEAALEGAPAGPPRLSDREFALLEDFTARRDALPAAMRARLESDLEATFRRRYPASVGGSEERSTYLRRVHADERARRRAARPEREGSTSPGRTLAERFVRAKEPRWRLLAGYLARARRPGLRALAPSELSEFAGLYRETAADLARARTYGADASVLFQLERLVAAGHSALYRRHHVSVGDVWQFLRRDFPRLVRRHSLPIGISATLLVVPAVVGYVRIWLEPELAYELLHPQIVARAESAPDRIAEGKGYVEIPSIFMPVAAGGIIANNVQVTFLAFALGITAGVGTLLLLLFNGVHIGATLALFDSLETGWYLWSFLLPHGIMELTAAAIAGGAGLLLGSALLLPREQTRREALVDRGGQAVRLLLGTSVLLVLAGLVEGFVSPSPWPPATKIAFGLGLGALLYLYLFFQGKDRSPQDGG